MPAKETPEAVTRKVTSAGSRRDSSRNASARLLPMVPSSAMPAMAMISSFGNAVNNTADRRTEHARSHT